MTKIEPFEKFFVDYESWFEKNKGFYLSELNLLKKLLGIIPQFSIEIGVGSGRFAAPLGIKYGVDPSPKMLKKAKERHIKVVRGIAEDLPIKSKIFDLALMVTTICFVDNPIRSFWEVSRILKDGGKFAVAFVDKKSFLGQLYEKKKQKSKFYKPAVFYSTEDILMFGEKTGFKPLQILQTIFSTDAERVHPVKENYGKGAFVGVLFSKG